MPSKKINLVRGAVSSASDLRLPVTKNSFITYPEFNNTMDRLFTYIGTVAGGDPETAAETAFTPTANVLSTNVQAAIEEISEPSYRLYPLIIAVSDEVTPLTTGTNKLTFRMPLEVKVTAVKASLTTAGSGTGTTTVDIKINGTTRITPNKLTIDVGELTSATAAVPVSSFSPTGIATEDVVTIDITTITSGAVEAGLKIYFIVYTT